MVSEDVKFFAFIAGAASCSFGRASPYACPLTAAFLLFFDEGAHAVEVVTIDCI